MTNSENAVSPVERRFSLILERSLKEAAAEDSEWICTEDASVHWFAFENRSDAIREFIAETDPWLRAKDVTCRREYLRVDLDQIEDAALDAAQDMDDDDPDVDTHVAYTFDGGFAWTACDRRAAGAKAFWRCEAR